MSQHPGDHLGPCNSSARFAPATQISSLNAFPNPAYSSASVEMTIASPEFVSVKAYNAMGRLVSTLFEGQGEPGIIYEFEFIPNDAKAGIFYIRMETQSGERFLQRLVFMK